MNRPTPRNRSFPCQLVLCLAVLISPAFTVAQSTAQPESNLPAAAAHSAAVDQSINDADAPTDGSPAGQMRTAAEIQAEAEAARDPADLTAASEAEPPRKTAVTASASAPAVQSTSEPPQGSHEPPKYDVSLIGRRDIGHGLNFYSIEKEIALGQDLARQVEASSRLVTDPEVTEYVNRIGQNLVRNSDSRVPFTIKVIDSDEVNAFALPGGFFYVDSGLILAADNEAELAAVMAHEIAHVAARHATKNMTKQQIWNIASIPLMFVGGPAAFAIAEVASIAVPMGFLKFSRDAEREADMLGLQYDYAAGYDPQAFVQFFEKLKVEEKKKHSKIARLFSTHPMNSERIEAAQDEIRTYLPDRDRYVVDTSDFEQMKVRLIALEGGLRLNVANGGSRPVLRKAPSLDSGDSDPSANPSSGPSDEGPPVLKRDPASTN